MSQHISRRQNLRSCQRREAPSVRRSPRGSSRLHGLYARGATALFVLIPLIACLTARVPNALGTETEDDPVYRLDSGDRVRLKIFEWRPSLDQVYEWKAMNDDFSVGADGTVSLPLVGDLKARGATTTEFGRQLGEAMRQHIGVGDLPNISVEVVNFRPFYIVGKVQKSGEFNYRPHLSVLQAISLAGGFTREIEPGQRLSREFITSQGDMAGVRARLIASLAKRARLEADLSGNSTVDFSNSGLDPRDPKTAALMRQESDILSAQRADLTARLAHLRDKKMFLNEELKALDAQLVTQDAKERLANEELEGVQQLLAKKLTVVPRRQAAQRNVYQLDGDRQLLLANKMRVRNEIDTLSSTIDELQSGRYTELVVALAATRAESDDASGRLATAKQLVLDTAELLPASLDDESDSQVKPIYTIVRYIGGGNVKMQVSETDLVRPGDTLKVDFDTKGLVSARRKIQVRTDLPLENSGPEQQTTALTAPEISKSKAASNTSANP